MRNPTRRSGGRKSSAAQDVGQSRAKKRPRYKTPSILTYTGDREKNLGPEADLQAHHAQGH